MKSVQIPYDLFIDLAMYHLRGEDDFGEEIQQGLEQKLDAMLNRQLYSQSKIAPTEEQREQARQEYEDVIQRNNLWRFFRPHREKAAMRDNAR